MAAKKAKRAKKPAASIRAKKSVRATDAVPVQTASVAIRAMSAPVPATPTPVRSTAMPARSTSAPARSTSPRAILFGLGAVAAVSLLIVALQPSERLDVASLSAPPPTMPLPAAIVPPQAIVLPQEADAAQLETTKPAAPKPVPATVARSVAADASTDKTAAIEPLKAVAIEPVAVVEMTPAAPESSKVSDLAANAVTITGCLASDDDTFVLKDTTGTDAPKARSWRSGFLKKRAATIELLDATNALRLPSFVGQRVEATGMLVNHEMRAQSLRRVAASCS